MRIAILNRGTLFLNVLYCASLLSYACFSPRSHTQNLGASYAPRVGRGSIRY
jgi:hypothetical protein